LGFPEQQRYIEKIEELEAYQLANQQQRMDEEIVERFPAPVFKVHVKEQPNIPEGGVAHFEARLEPVGDPRLTVQWFKDNKPMEAS
jgi:hypothetical protein